MKRDFLQLKKGYIHRKRMDDLLEQGMRYPLISVIGGPGYGKTMAVAGYALHTPMRLVWLRLQKPDSDLSRLWTHLEEAVARELPELAAPLSKTALSSLLGLCDAVAQLLAHSLERGPPILVVLDNFEYVSSSRALEFLELLVRAELPGLHIVVITNEKLPIGAIAPSSGQFRLSAEELCFTDEEIAALFTAYEIHFTRENIRQAAELTGRWPLALHMICANHQGGPLDDLQKDITHQQLAAELFSRHYYSGYEEELQILLVKLSCFSRFPLELVNYLAAENSPRFVDALSLNAFISYDFTLELFQFQTMYRDFLSHRQALLPPEETFGMYAFMGKWYLEHGFHFEALDCFWAVRDYERYLATVTALPRVRLGTHITAEILDRLEQFPAEFSAENPVLGFSKAVLLLNSMRVEQARSQLLRLLEQLEQEPMEEAARLIAGDICVVLADIALLLNRDDGLGYMKKAVGYLPGGCRIRTRELLLVGNNSAFFLPGNGTEQLAHMEEYFFTYALYADLVTNGSGYGHEWLFAAQAAFLAERFDRSRECCFQAIAKASITGQHDIICNAYWDLIRTELYMGDYPGAKKWLEQLLNYIGASKIPELYELRDCAQSWYYLRVGAPDQVAPWIADIASQMTGHLLDVGRNRIIIIYYLSALGRLNEAYAEISRLEERFQLGGRWHEKNLLLIHKAIRLLERGDKPEAVAVFKQAYDMVYPDRIAAIFAEFGGLTQRLVRVAASQSQVEFDPDWLEVLYKKAGSFEKRAAAVKKAYRQEHFPQEEAKYHLNARETEILTYIAQGMTRAEISQLMETSLSNVKRYINNIYIKLGALNRADAIHIATINGILDQEE